MAEAPKPKPVTLRDFVKNDKDLISVIGVFTALTVFSANIGHGILSVWLSASFMFVTIVLWVELFSGFPAECTERLKTFRFVLFFGVVALFLYWLGLIAWISKGTLTFLIYVTILSLLAFAIEPMMSLVMHLPKSLTIPGMVLIIALLLFLPWFAARWLTAPVAYVGTAVRVGFTGVSADSLARGRR